MLVLSDNNLLNRIKNYVYKVYLTQPLAEGVECYNSDHSFTQSDTFYISRVSIKNIKHADGKFYYTKEDLSNTADWFPLHVIPIGKQFKPVSNSNKLNCVTRINNKQGKSIKSRNCLVDISELPAFSSVNEDTSIYEYRIYLTLFNNYTVKQCHYERHNLQDAVIKSSKYDLIDRIQNSDFLKSKDFTMINLKRSKEESVRIGLVIKEENNNYNIEYGTLYINMNNKIYIIWH